MNNKPNQLPDPKPARGTPPAVQEAPLLARSARTIGELSLYEGI